jgi:N-acetylneuraminic acid mutarotase
VRINEGELLVYGGCDPTKFMCFDDLWKFDLDKSCWTEVKQAPHAFSPEEREGAAGVKLGNSLIILGGVNTKRYFDDVWSLDLTTVSSLF